MWLRWTFSVVFWTFMVTSCIVMFPLAVAIWALTAPIDPRKRILHQFTCFWGSLYSWLNPAWPVRVTGRDRIQPGVTYVMVANHQSLLDILVLFRLFVHFKWVSKVENFKIPCVGWNMRLNRYIELKRGDRESVLQMLDACRDTLRRGSSIMMFPEGTRSHDGRLKRFKPGAFELAKDTGTAILPIVVEGTANALPKKGVVLRGRHPIRIRVLDPIPHRSFANDPVEALTDRVHAIFAGELEEKTIPPAR